MNLVFLALAIAGEGARSVAAGDDHRAWTTHAEEPPGVLQRQGDGYVVPDLVTTLHVAADGRARFFDQPDFAIRRVRWTTVTDHLAAWYRDPYAQTRARRYQDLPRHEQAVLGGWDAGAGGDTGIDGRVMRPGAPAGWRAGIVPLVEGTADATSWLHRRFVGDPYASRKRALLDRTHAERARLRERHDRDQRGDSARAMQDNVARVLREVHAPGVRNAALFALWDECLEGDDEAGQAGESARAVVIAALRALSADRPSARAITAFDARRASRQHFAPYP